MPLPRSNMRMPLFFKLWFAFVATLALGIMGFMVWAVVQVVEAGPEGVGRAIGAVARGFNDASR